MLGESPVTFSRPARRVRVGLLAVLLVLVAAAAARSTYLVLEVRAELLSSRGTLVALAADGPKMSAAQVDRSLRSAGAATSRARGHTRELTWRVAERVPVLGRNLVTVRALVAASDGLLQGQRSSIAELLSGLTTLRDAPRGPEQLRAIRRLRPSVDALAAGLADARKREARGPRTMLLPPVGDAREKFATQLERLSEQARAGTSAVRLLPGMLGQTGRRRYLLAIQNNAESRATGGLIGQYGVLLVRDGVFRLEKVAPITALSNDFTEPAVQLDPEFEARYDRFSARTDWTDANMSPDWPTVSTILLAMYRRSTGEQLDGTIAVDPAAMARFLALTGPVRASDGTTVTADNLVRLSLSDVYRRFDTAESARKPFLSEVARALYGHLFATPQPLRQLADAFTAGVREQRIFVASAHPDEQAELATQAVGGALPSTGAPFLAVINQNLGGNKLDYYLSRRMTYTVADGSGPQEATLTIRLRNDAPSSGLPLAVAGHVTTDQVDNRPGVNRTYLSVYVTRGAVLQDVSAEGAMAPVQQETERGLPVWSSALEVGPGSERTVTYRFTVPHCGHRCRPVVRRQALVATDSIAIQVP